MLESNEEKLLFEDCYDKIFVKNEEYIWERKGTRQDPKASNAKKVLDFKIKNIVENNKNIVVLAGAGTSVLKDSDGKDKGGKVMKNLAEDIDLKLRKEPKTEIYISEIAKEFGIIDESTEKKVKLETNNDGEDKLPEEERERLEKINLENLLSKLLLFRDNFKEMPSLKNIKYKKLNDIINCILEKILEDTTCYKYNKDFSHGEFIKKISGLIDHSEGERLSIVTTNYDMLFEDAAGSIDYTVVDGFSYSYNPKFNSDMFNWDFTHPIDHVSSNEIEYNANVINLLKIHGSVNWLREGNTIKRLNRKISKKELENKKSVMIFPSSEKYMQTYEEPYFNLMVKFQELIRQPDTLLITTGFSFADNHIAEMVIQAIKRNNGLKILVTDYEIEEEPKEEKPEYETGDRDMLKKFGGLKELKDAYPISFLKASFNGDLLDFIFGREDEQDDN